jgi:hypothetical protein
MFRLFRVSTGDKLGKIKRAIHRAYMRYADRQSLNYYGRRTWDNHIMKIYLDNIDVHRLQLERAIHV